MSDNDKKALQAYTFNLFAYPNGYFESKTAEELKVSEEVRTELIRLQNEHFDSPTVSTKERENKFLEDFISEFEDE